METIIRLQQEFKELSDKNEQLSQENKQLQEMINVSYQSINNCVDDSDNDNDIDEHKLLITDFENVSADNVYLKNRLNKAKYELEVAERKLNNANKEHSSTVGQLNHEIEQYTIRIDSLRKDIDLLKCIKNSQAKTIREYQNMIRFPRSEYLNNIYSSSFGNIY